MKFLMWHSFRKNIISGVIIQAGGWLYFLKIPIKLLDKINLHTNEFNLRF